MANDFTRDLADEAATLQFGAVLAKVIQPNLTIYLHGDLGAGKTTLVRGLLHALGHVGKVKSPTYTLVESYEIKSNVSLNLNQPKLNLYHFDLYRLSSYQEFIQAGFDEYLYDDNALCFIEWPEILKSALPASTAQVTLQYASDEKRLIVVE